MSKPSVLDRPANLLGGFAAIDKANAADFVGRLDVMSAIDFFRRYKAETFRLMDMAAGAHVGDVGCGTGEDARALAGLVGPGGSVTAFDLSEAMLAEAARRHGDAAANLRFVRAGLDDLRVDDAAFDAVRVDRVLVHVPDPARALKELVRTVRPGGRVVISEPDMASVWATTSMPDVGRIILDGVARSVANPLVARSLVDLFLDAGLTNVHIEARAMVINDPEPGERILNLSAVAEALVRNGSLELEQAQRWLGELFERNSVGRFLGGLTIFIVAGVRPR
jgi:ubiquinone/menaquinone biosynthesis C-methylase UbiE